MAQWLEDMYTLGVRARDGELQGEDSRGCAAALDSRAKKRGLVATESHPVAD